MRMPLQLAAESSAVCRYDHCAIDRGGFGLGPLKRDIATFATSRFRLRIAKRKVWLFSNIGNVLTHRMSVAVFEPHGVSFLPSLGQKHSVVEILGISLALKKLAATNIKLCIVFANIVRE